MQVSFGRWTVLDDEICKTIFEFLIQCPDNLTTCRICAGGVIDELMTSDD